MSVKKILFCLLSVCGFYKATGQTQQLKLLSAYAGTWVIFKGDTEHDTLCVTTSRWSKDHTRLLAGQVVYGNNGVTRDSCFYSYDADKKVYPYHETDETGKNAAITSDIVIDGNTWIYNHHIKSTKLYRTLNTFNTAGNEITYQSQRSDDGGNSWITTRSGKEYRIKK